MINSHHSRNRDSNEVTNVTRRTRVFVVPWRPRSGRSRYCESCGISWNAIDNTQVLVGHPWGINDAAWWCVGCLRAAGYAPERMDGTKPFPPVSWVEIIRNREA